MVSSLEEELLFEVRKNPNAVPIDAGLLVLAGLPLNTISEYLKKLTRVQDDFHRTADPSATESQESCSQALFDYLWKSKPQRYKKTEQFHLNDMIDAQLHPNPREGVGDCRGLTALYNALAQREGIAAALIYSQEIAGSELHLKSRLRLSNRKIRDVENTRQNGYNAPTVKKYVELPGYAIFATTYHERSRLNTEKGNLKTALEESTLAIEIEPRYSPAYVGRAYALSGMERYREAVEDSTRALALTPKFTQAYLNRALALCYLQHLEGALADCNQALKLKPDNQKARELKKWLFETSNTVTR